MIYYRDSTFEQCRDAAASANRGQPQRLSTWRMTQAEALRNYRDAVAGGERARRFLARRPDEDALLWQMRVEAFQNIGICEIVVDEQSHFAYGEPPERSVTMAGAGPDDERNEILDRVVKDIYTSNGDYVFYRGRLIPSSVTDQWAWQKTWYDKANGNAIRFSRLLREDVYPVRDPMDPDNALLGVVECRPGAGLECDYWLWTIREVFKITADWEIESREPNPYGPFKVIPFIPYGDISPGGQHQIADALFDQVVFINMRSWELAGWRAQAFATFVAVGNMITEETVSELDGQKRTQAGMNRFLQFEKDGEFYAVNPNFPIEQIRKAQSDMVLEALERAKVSSLALDSSGAPQQPWTMMMRYLRPLQDRKLNIAMFTGSELMTLRAVIAAINVTGRLPVDPDSLDYRVDFPKTILPINEIEHQKQDADDVEADRMLLDDYVGRWVKAGAKKEEIDAYVEALMAQKSEKHAGLATSLGLAPKMIDGPVMARQSELYPELEPPKSEEPQTVG